MLRSYHLALIGTVLPHPWPPTACRATGWRVAVIDHQPFGGTCALHGCDPKKVLIAFKRSSTTPVPQQHEEAFKADLIRPEASSVTGVFWAVT